MFLPSFSPLLTLVLFLTACVSSRSLFPFLKGGGGDKPQKPIQPPKSSLSIPSIGLGLWKSKDTLATDSVVYAFAAGYNHFDSAAAYSNEKFVGEGLAQGTNDSRSSYWITSKLFNDRHQPSLVEPAIRQTLKDLNTTYLDLYLMHWPVAFVPNKGSRTIIDQDTTILDTWHAMEDLVRKNLTRYIGISNFSPRQIDGLLKSAEIRPYAHEFETHPYLQQSDFVDWHFQNDIKVIAYSPLANLNPTYNGTHSKIAPILEDEFWIDVAARHNATVVQAILAWNLQRGCVVIPKSTHEKRIVENIGAVKNNITFTDDEMLQILEQDKRARFNDPGKNWGVDLFEGLDDGTNRFWIEEEL